MGRCTVCNGVMSVSFGMIRPLLCIPCRIKFDQDEDTFDIDQCLQDVQPRLEKMKIMLERNTNA